MSILSEAIEELKNDSKMNFSYDTEIIIFNSERLMNLLYSNKHIVRKDREIIIDMLNIFINMYNY